MNNSQTTSGQYLFNPDLAELVDEAFERVGIDPASITLRHIKSARRSMNFMLSHWTTLGVAQWAVEQAEQPVTPGMQTYELPAGAVDIMQASLRRSGVEVEMYPISRGDYQAIPRKDDRGRADRYFVDREVGSPTVYLWQTPDNDTDVIVYWYFRQFQDVGQAMNTLDIPHYFYEAFAAGLAAKLAEKYMPARLGEKVQIAQMTLDKALAEDGSRAPLRIGVRYGRQR